MTTGYSTIATVIAAELAEALERLVAVAERQRLDRLTACNRGSSGVARARLTDTLRTEMEVELRREADAIVTALTRETVAAMAALAAMHRDSA